MKQHELHAYFILFFLGKSGYQSQLWKCHCTCIVQLFYINAKCLLAYGFLFYRFVLYIFISYVFCHGNQCLHNNIVMYCMFCVVYSSYFIGMFNLVLCACVCGGGHQQNHYLLLLLHIFQFQFELNPCGMQICCMVYNRLPLVFIFRIITKFSCKVYVNQ